VSRPSTAGGHVRPLAVGYLRVHAADPPEIAAALTARMGACADREGLMLADVYTDLLDPPAGHPDRAGVCALMDALRRDDVCAVVIPTADHLFRRPSGYTARRTILEVEAGASHLVIAGAS